MHIQIVNGLKEFEEFREQWDSLNSRGEDHCVFSSFDWVKNIVETLCGNSNFICILIFNANKKILIGGLPLLIRKKNVLGKNRRVLQHATSVCTDFSVVLCCQNSEVCQREVIKKITESILSMSDQWDILHFDNLSTGSAAANLFRHYLSRRFQLSSYVNVTNPITNLEINFEDSKNIRDLKRREKKLRTEFENVEFVINGEVNNTIYEAMLNNHRSTFPGIGFNNKENQVFFLKIIDRVSENIEFSYLTLNGKFAAGHFGFKNSSKIFYYVPTYDKGFSKFGVGQLLLWKMIQEYKSKGFNEFDLLRGDESYKDYWLTDVRSNFSVILLSNNNNRFFDKLYTNLWVTAKCTPFIKKAVKKYLRK